jgi:hypothetical protein
MSGNSLASLLAWMKGNTRMLGWGLVVALERRKTNLIILQEYIKRFSQSSSLPPIRGEMEIVANKRMEVIHDFVMDVPVLSFENAGLNDSKAMLTMAVTGGNQLTMEKESVGWKVYKVDEIDPLQGPKLHLDLLLNEVPGNVNGDGRVRLDLRKSDNFRLTFAESDNEQRIGGAFFKDLFNKLPDEQRIYTLGKIERGTNDLMRPQSFELRTQANGTAARDPHSSVYGDGAVLALVRMERRLGGDFPGASYKYLIPDDQGKDYSATILFDRGRALVTAMLDAVGGMVGSRDFKFDFDGAGELLKATISSGAFVVPKLEFEQSVSLPPDGKLTNIKLFVDEMIFPVSSSSPLVVEVSGGKVQIGFASVAVAGVKYSTPGQSDGVYNIRCGINLVAEYEVVESTDGVLLRQTRIDATSTYEYVDANDESAARNDFWDLIVFLLMELFLHVSYTVAMIERIKGYFVAFLEFEQPLNETIADIIKLNFGQAIQGDEIHAPHDIGFFGRINPTSTSFQINPIQPLIKQGGSLQFATQPVVAGVQWKVENLVEGPNSPGTISASGMYQAPPASAIKGRSTRVRVTATAPGTGYHSSALVTVLLNELSVNPLIQVCDVNTSVELAAGSLGGARLQWSIKNPVAEESGEIRQSEKPGGDHTYHHGPVVANKTYVLDEIEVKNTQTNVSRSVHVLALQKAPGATVKILDANIAQGTVKLEAIVNGTSMPAEWSLPLEGPGSISQTGLYQAPQTTTERYVLIFAVIDGGPFGKFEGHLILPLPLVAFPQALGLPG